MSNLIDIEQMAENIRNGLDEAERRLTELRDQRSAINDEIKRILGDVKALERLQRAVTPRDQDGADE
jgi:chromosome segregation ATPase